MAPQRVTVNIQYGCGAEVNWMGCNGHVVAVVLLERAVLSEVELVDHQGTLCAARFHHFQLAEGYEL